MSRSSSSIRRCAAVALRSSCSFAAAERARAAGARRLTLIVSPGNAAAQALYARLGFTTLGTLLYGYRGAAPRRFAESAVGRGALDDATNDPAATIRSARRPSSPEPLAPYPSP